MRTKGRYTDTPQKTKGRNDARKGGTMRGLDFALNDIGLAIFTTLAPVATVAYIVLALVALFGRLSPRERRCLESWLILPLAIATIGLIASATHLGTPSNALYVFTNVGQSPLSTEVFCAVVFLGTACSYWLACIYFAHMRVVRVVWLLASLGTALAFLWGTTQAYGFSTVITWDTVFVRLNLPLTGIAGSAPLALLVLTTCGQAHRRRLAYALVALSAVATLLASISMGAQCLELQDLRNAYGTASSLVPLYPAAIVAFVLLSLGACALALVSLRAYWGANETPSFEEDSPAERRAGRRLVVACLLAYIGVFGVRFAFYCFHMTAGVV